MLVFALLLLGVNHGSALDDVNEGITYEELALMNRELVEMNRELMQTIKATDQRMSMMERKMEKLEGAELMQTIKAADQRMSMMERKMEKLEGAELMQTIKATDQRMSMMERKMEQLEGADVSDAMSKVSTHTHVSRFVVDSNDEQVAFLAIRNDMNNVGLPLGPSNIIFETVLTNIDNHYDNSSGIFTAPRRGLYLISATILSPVDAEVRATIMVNNVTPVVSIFGHGSGGERDSGSQVALLNLKQDDTVAVFNDTVIEYPPWTHLPFNSFTGVMLFAY